MSSIIKPRRRGDLVMVGSPEVGSGMEVLSVKDMVNLFDSDPKLREAVALAERVEGHQKMVRQVWAKQNTDSSEIRAVEHNVNLARKNAKAKEDGTFDQKEQRQLADDKAEYREAVRYRKVYKAG